MLLLGANVTQARPLERLQRAEPNLLRSKLGPSDAPPAWSPTADPSSASSAPSSPNNDEWAEGRRYLGLDMLAKSRLTKINNDTESEAMTPRRAHRIECKQRITR